MTKWVDGRGREYGMPDGVVTTLYGGLGFRYWLGTPGQSELIAGSVHFWEPVLEEDQAEFEAGLKREACRRVGRTLGVQTGLVASDGDLDRIEWLVIWHPEADMLDRLRAFEQGWSAILPQGKRARDLDSADLGALTRRMGLHTRPRRRVDATEGTPELPETGPVAAPVRHED